MIYHRKRRYEDFLHYRRPLYNTYQKLTEEKKLNVVYFGGSITHGYGCSDIEKTSWRALSVQWFKNNFPDATIHDTRAAIGESGTFLGVYRLERDVLSQNPDLLFIEFAINDLSHGTTQKTAAMQYETIVREVKSRYPQCDIVTLLTESWGTAAQKTLYPAAQGHEDISKVYDISTLWVGKALVHEMTGINEKEWRKYFIDTVHPCDAGYKKYYDCVEEFLYNSLLADVPIPDAQLSVADMYTVPEQQSEVLLDGERRFELCTPQICQNSIDFFYSNTLFMNLPRTPYVGYIYTKEASAELHYEFQGTEIGVYSNFYDKEKVEISVDGEPWKQIFCSIHNPTVVAQHLNSGRHILKLRPLLDENVLREMKIGAILTRDENKATYKIKRRSL